MDITTMRIVVTLASLACFLGIWYWAYTARNRAQFDEAAQLPSPMTIDCSNRYEERTHERLHQ